MSEVVKESINVAGLLTNVYSRSDLRNKDSSSEPVVGLFILQGRLDSSDTVDPTARAAFAWAAERQASSSKQDPRDFVVVTFVRGFSSSSSSSFHSPVFSDFGAGNDVIGRGLITHGN